MEDRLNDVERTSKFIIAEANSLERSIQKITKNKDEYKEFLQLIVHRSNFSTIAADLISLLMNIVNSLPFFFAVGFVAFFFAVRFVLWICAFLVNLFNYSF